MRFAFFSFFALFLNDVASVQKLKAKKSADRIVPRSNATVDGGDSESICFGTDDRVRSFDARVRRFSPVGCTAWLVAEDVFVTAGHCVDFAPSALPDGYFVEFNVPLSAPDGVSVRSAPEDVYAVRYDIGGTFPVGDLSGSSATIWETIGTPADCCRTKSPGENSGRHRAVG